MYGDARAHVQALEHGAWRTQSALCVEMDRLELLATGKAAPMTGKKTKELKEFVTQLEACMCGLVGWVVRLCVCVFVCL